jgi:acetyltransferase-like isoleucine patch superfamily enzyme
MPAPLPEQRSRLAEMADAPWKVFNEARRILLLPVSWLYFAVNRITFDSTWRIYGLPLIQRHRGSEIRIGKRLHMRNWFSSNPLGVNHKSILATWSADSSIYLGDDVRMSGATICASEEIRIGSRVRIGANSTIIDTDFHPLGAETRNLTPKAGRSVAVFIDDDVFIGTRAIILKGSRIGRGAVIGAGSVVAGEIPAYAIAAGNPAVIVRQAPPLETHHA